jgi:hypothetical protein
LIDLENKIDSSRIYLTRLEHLRKQTQFKKK